jgi:hypothetical protein
VNYAELSKMSSFFTSHILLEVDKIQDLPSKIGETLEDVLIISPCV